MTATKEIAISNLAKIKNRTGRPKVTLKGIGFRVTTELFQKLESVVIEGYPTITEKIRYILTEFLKKW